MFLASVIFIFLFQSVFLGRGMVGKVGSEKPSEHVSIKYACVFMKGKGIVWKSHQGVVIFKVYIFLEWSDWSIEVSK